MAFQNADQVSISAAENSVQSGAQPKVDTTGAVTGESGVEYASAHRRMLAALVDIIVILLVLMPVDMFMEKFILNDRTFSYLLEQYSNMHKESKTIELNGLLTYLYEQGWVFRFALAQFITFFLIGCYSIGFMIWKAATPGKILMRCVVVDVSSGLSVGKWQSFIRFFGYVISTLVMCIGFVFMHFTPRNRALHDYIAGTAVIIQQNGVKNGSAKSI